MKTSFLALFCLLVSAPVYAEDVAPAEATGLLKEIGVTVGTPGAVNLNVGLWGTSGVPLLVRVSGMHLGSLYGVQGDFGWAFDREGSFKQYVALSVIKFRIDTPKRFFDFSGIGAVYGFNLSGFSVQAGYYGPSSSNNPNINLENGIVSNQRSHGAFQLGYTFVW